MLSKGAISVKSIDLDGSNARLYGIWLDNHLSTTKAGVTLGVGSTVGNNNEITNFVNNGLYIYTNGSVAIDRVELSNISDGIMVNNTFGGTGTGAVSITN